MLIRPTTGPTVPYRITKGCHNIGGGCPGGHFVELVAKLTATLSVDENWDDKYGHAYHMGGRPVEYDIPIVVRFVSTPSLGVNGAKWAVKDFEEYVDLLVVLFFNGCPVQPQWAAGVKMCLALAGTSRRCTRSTWTASAAGTAGSTTTSASRSTPSTTR